MPNQQSKDDLAAAWNTLSTADKDCRNSLAALYSNASHYKPQEFMKKLIGLIDERSYAEGAFIDYVFGTPGNAAHKIWYVHPLIEISEFAQERLDEVLDKLLNDNTIKGLREYVSRMKFPDPEKRMIYAVSQKDMVFEKKVYKN
jgi:hypothetical protein